MFNDFYEKVKQIPKGMVASYGYIAVSTNHPRCARRVGHALHQNPDPENIPCHRVVFKDGSLSPSFKFGGLNMQYKLLKDEGVEFIQEQDGEYKVDMQKCSLDKIR